MLADPYTIEREPGRGQHAFIYSRGGVELLLFSRNLGTQTALNLDLFVSTRARVEWE